jgi:hypothetical protein
LNYWTLGTLKIEINYPRKPLSDVNSQNKRAKSKENESVTKTLESDKENCWGMNMVSHSNTIKGLKLNVPKPTTYHNVKSGKYWENERLENSRNYQKLIAQITQKPPIKNSERPYKIEPTYKLEPKKSYSSGKKSRNTKRKDNWHSKTSNYNKPISNNLTPQVPYNDSNYKWTRNVIPFQVDTYLANQNIIEERKMIYPSSIM